MSIYESGEDYLLAILVIKERKGICHSIDVAEETGYSKASVSIAMKKREFDSFEFYIFLKS
ncbi:hypothetical protein [Bulleidia sp. zg-1006]|uniref:hypothetical protein n=1 Tax=Bulleidia sp. zg-1006 TaxID=2806552 RepID=UPI001EED5027|nr:hypothetical protein [Bulleidia sp. zg-1006]